MGKRLLLMALMAAVQVLAAELTEAKVFEWWDDGLIAPEEANEILSLMDEGNMREACALAEIYSGEPCGDPAIPMPDSVRKFYHGHYTTKLRLDSTGRVSSHRKELELAFRRLALRLGTQELLTYRSKRGEAHFGQVSSRELHSEIPLDTFWGTALSYSLGKFRLSAMLDTSKVTNIGITAGPFSKFTAQAAIWYSKGDSASTDSPSGSLTLTVPSGGITAWYQAGQSSPLVRFSFRTRNTSAFSWSTTGYIHGDSIPAPARLSASILKNSFWSTQNLTLHAKDFFDTKATVGARVTRPLHSDSISGRFSIDISGGPEIARPAIKVTCIEAASDCDQTIYQAKIASSHAFGQKAATFTGGARTRHERSGNSWQAPRLEIAAELDEIPARKSGQKNAGSRRNSYRIALVAPEASPQKKLQVRTETRIYGDFLEFALTAAFQRTETSNFHPTHAQVTAGFFF
ncbi:MAG: hypothetical protein IKP90_04450 [Fibrobacter sp.]|nr:hypothetical protein [Fibrobacter sp.]